MVNIKVTEKVHEFEGEVINGVVKSFGTSAHIPFSKKFMGRKVKIIVPAGNEGNNDRVWVLTDKELEEFVGNCKKALKEQPESRLTFHKKGVIENIETKNFSENDLVKAIEILKQSKNKKDIEISKKIEKVYGL